MLKRTILPVLAAAGLAVSVPGAAADDPAADPSIDEEYQEEMIEEMLNLPLEERMKDIEDLAEFENRPEELAKNSNDVISLKKVEFDRDKLLLVYLFELHIPDEMRTPAVAGDYAMKMQEMITEQDCAMTHFAHRRVGNAYKVYDASSGKVVADFVTSADRCDRSVRVPLAH